MATNNEIAAFEDFRFSVGDMVRLVLERVATEITVEEADEAGAVCKVTSVIGMVMSRWLGQDESGISRFYNVKGVEFSGTLKEFELELVRTTQKEK